MNKQNGVTNMSEEIKDIMDALENNELKNDGFWGRACSRLSQQLQAAKEENEKLKNQNKLFKGTIKKFNLDWYGEELDTLTKQNKQMQKALEKVRKIILNCRLELECQQDVDKTIDIIEQALKGGQ